MTTDVPIDAIYRIARRKIRDPWLAEDVAQTACLYALTQRPARPWQYVVDAVRSIVGRPGELRYARRLVSYEDRTPRHYPTASELRDRWLAEESEEQAAEWLAASASERDRRIAESDRALGTSGG